MLKPQVVALFDEYQASHQHPTNRLTHKIAIPFIVLHIVTMLDWVHLMAVPLLPGGVLTLGLVALALSAIWYLRASVKLGLLVVAFMVACVPLGRMLPPWSVVAIAVLSWLVQLAGHSVWEKKSPAFLTNLVQALVGPLFFVAVLLGDYVLKPQPPTTAPVRA